MKRNRVLWLAGMVLVAYWSMSSAQAQHMKAEHIPCGQRDKIENVLKGTHGEIVVMRGLIAGMLFELWRAPNGSFTATVTRPDNQRTCLIASGTGLHYAHDTTGEAL